MRLLDGLRASGRMAPDGQRIEVNRAHPLADRLTFAVWAGNPVGGPMRDMCGNLPPFTLYNSNLAYFSSSCGISITDAYTYTQINPSFIDLNQGTILWFGNLDTLSNSDGMLCGVQSGTAPGSSGYPSSYLCVRVVGNGNWGTVYNNGNNYQQNTPQTVGPHVLVSAFQAGVSAKLYVDGVTVESNVYSATTAPSTAVFAFGGSSRARSVLGMYWRRCLSDAEVAQVSANPFAAFRAATPVPMWSVPAAASVRRPLLTVVA